MTAYGEIERLANELTNAMNLIDSEFSSKVELLSSDKVLDLTVREKQDLEKQVENAQSKLYENNKNNIELYSAIIDYYNNVVERIKSTKISTFLDLANYLK